MGERIYLATRKEVEEGAAGGLTKAQVEVIAEEKADAAVIAKLELLTVHAEVSGNGTATAQYLTPVNATAGNVTQKLPEGLPKGALIAVEKVDATEHEVILEGQIRTSTKTSTLALKLQHETLLLETDGSGFWWPLAGHDTLGALDARYVHQNGEGLPSSVVSDSRGAAGGGRCAAPRGGRGCALFSI